MEEEKVYVAYMRVSTSDQGVSHLGLDAQKRDINYFIERNGGTVIDYLVEIKSATAKKADQRPILDMAIKLCKETGATLLIAKIDRLYRSVYFIQKLKQEIEFIAVDNPNINNLSPGS